MIEFYEYDGEDYEFTGAIDNGEVVEGDVEWVLDFIDKTDGVEITDEDEVVQRVSNEYFVAVVPA